MTLYEGEPEYVKPEPIHVTPEEPRGAHGDQWYYPSHLHNTLTNLNLRLDRHRRAIAALQDHVADDMVRIDSLATKVTEAQTRILYLETLLDRADHRIEDLGEIVGVLQSNLANLDERTSLNDQGTVQEINALKTLFNELVTLYNVDSELYGRNSQKLYVRLDAIDARLKTLEETHLASGEDSVEIEQEYRTEQAEAERRRHWWSRHA
jgi:chromosome segregation ATPase